MANEAEIIASNILSSAIEYKRLYDTTKNNEYKVKEQRLRRIAENVKLLLSSSSTSSVNSFNGRTGAVVLTSADVTGALGYTPPTNLNGLTDVTISAPANAQVLTYNSTTSQWENQTPAGGGGGDMLKATYDTDNSGIVDKAEALTTLGRNSTGATLYEGTIVRIEGSTGNRPNFVKAQANNDANSAQTFGVVMTDIANNSDGYVLVQGTLHDLDTRTGAGGATHPFTDVTLADGDLLFLHPTIAGYVTNIKPSAPQHLVYVGVVTRTSPTNGTIVYRVQNGYELYELHDVAPTPYINNGVLYRDTATNLWKSATIATILGGTPLLSVPTLAQVTTAGNTTTNAITVGGLTISNGSASITKTTAGATLTLTPNASDNAIVINNNGFIKFTSSTDSFIRGTSTIFSILDASYVSKVQFHWGGSASWINTGGNLLIGTTTDAGYKLDVNGTARVLGTHRVWKDNQIGEIDLNLYNGNVGWQGGMYYRTESGGFNQRLTFYSGGAIGTADALTILASSRNVGVGTIAPIARFQVTGQIAAALALAQGVYFNNTLVQAAASDVLTAFQITPTFTVDPTLLHNAYWMRFTGAYSPSAYNNPNNNATTLDLANSFTNTANAIGLRIRHTYSNVQNGYGILLESASFIGIAQTSTTSTNYLAGATAVGSAIAPLGLSLIHI